MGESTVYRAVLNWHGRRDTIGCHIQGACGGKHLSYIGLHIASHIASIGKSITNKPLLLLLR